MRRGAGSNTLTLSRYSSHPVDTKGLRSEGQSSGPETAFEEVGSDYSHQVGIAQGTLTETATPTGDSDPEWTGDPRGCGSLGSGQRPIRPQALWKSPTCS